MRGTYNKIGAFRSYVGSFSRIVLGVPVLNSVRVGSLERACSSGLLVLDHLVHCIFVENRITLNKIGCRGTALELFVDA